MSTRPESTRPLHGDPGVRSRAGFSLIELLVVMAIITILAAMITSSAANARQSAFRARAQTELRELVHALKTYWMTYGAWPPELESAWGGDETRPIAVSRNLLESLRGAGDPNSNVRGVNTRNIVFLELSDRQIRGEYFTDPWGSPYLLYLSSMTVDQNALKFFFDTAVTFPMRDRYKY